MAMPVHIALLRGVNVGGNTLKMARLRALCTELGLKNAETYLQSGNLIFEAAAPSARWTRVLEEKLAGETRLPVSVIVRSAAELARIAAGNPFLKEPGIEPERLHVTFLSRAPAKSAWRALEALDSGLDRFEAAGTEIYLHCPNGYGRTRLSNDAFEKRLAVRATTRNWNTVGKLCELSSGGKSA
jgi:uncharacterized protein (DUF1697 family)